MNGIRIFDRYIGIDYSGAMTPTSSLKGLRVYMADGISPPLEVQPPEGSRKYWIRRGIAGWLAILLSGDRSTLVGIDHGFSFSLRYFQENDVPLAMNASELIASIDSEIDRLKQARSLLGGTGTANGAKPATRQGRRVYAHIPPVVRHGLVKLPAWGGYRDRNVQFVRCAWQNRQDMEKLLRILGFFSSGFRKQPL